MRRPYVVVGIYALLAVLVVPVYPHFVSPGELSRWLLDASIYEHGTIEVTRLAPILGPRFEDLAQVGDRLYSNKAPGSALLTLPGYAAARSFTADLRGLVFGERLLGATLPLLLLAFLFVLLGKRWNVEEKRISTIVAMLLFATPLFAYGLLLWAHALAAAALFGAWHFLHVNRRDVIAGALIGLAVSSEYPMVFPAIVLIAPLVTEPRRLLRVFAGGLPFAIALGVYHNAAFGSPFTNPYVHSRLPEYRKLIGSGAFGLHLPSPERLFRLLLDPAYGLLVFSPVLVLSVSAFAAARRVLPCRAWWTLLLPPLIVLLVYSGYPYWHGGWNPGPRFLMPAVPFLIAPMLFGKGGRMEAALFGASTLAVTLTTLVFPFVPRAFSFPWMSLAAPLLGSGLVAPNVFHLVWRPLAIVVPFALVLVAVLLGNGARRSLYAVVGALIAIMIGAREPGPAAQLQRAYIANVYFEQPGALEGQIPPSLQRRRELEMTLPPSSWRF